VPTQVIELVERFARKRDAYVAGGINETQLRRVWCLTALLRIIDPFFETLGWDIANVQGSALPYRDVIFEDSVKVGGKNKSLDYSFRIGGMSKFFVEAKKPAVNISSDSGSALQVRRYAWSAKLPLSILTNLMVLPFTMAASRRSRPMMSTWLIRPVGLDKSQSRTMIRHG